ncbi:MAG: glutamate racemase [Calditrichaeota bacterium]|nr:MAG: glutamate racemase [Calditrichota bacterium]
MGFSLSNSSQKLSSDSPIGIFDSGIGGLTVVRQLISELPNENLIYLGDSARVPYGSKSSKAVIQFSIQISNFLLKQNVKIIVVACNTASAKALSILKEKFQIPIIGVIEPAAKKAVETTKNGKIGVIGTTGTILSQAYFREIQDLNPKIEVFSKACPLFVPFVEEGWIEEEATSLVAKKYLAELVDAGIDTLILGCTHYPLLKKVIQKEVGSSVILIDSGHETAIFAAKVLKETNLLNFEKNVKPSQKYFLTDLPLKFTEVGSNFLGSKIESVEQVSLD